MNAVSAGGTGGLETILSFEKIISISITTSTIFNIPVIGQIQLWVISNGKAEYYVFGRGEGQAHHYVFGDVEQILLISLWKTSEFFGGIEVKTDSGSFCVKADDCFTRSITQGVGRLTKIIVRSGDIVDAFGFEYNQEQQKTIFEFKHEANSIDRDWFANICRNPLDLIEITFNETMVDLYTLNEGPKISKLTVYLKSMDGVAHTLRIGRTRQIHFSIDYLKKLAVADSSIEFRGVLKHEMTHCVQYNACNSLPHGLVEGIADYLRMKADLAHPSWKQSIGGSWKDGYATTAYFLLWVESFRKNFVIDLNLACRDHVWDELIVYQLTGYTLTTLWGMYIIDKH